MTPIHWVPRGTGIPKHRDEVNRREVYECDGWVCDVDMMGDPSKLRWGYCCLSWIKKAGVLFYYESRKREQKKSYLHCHTHT